MECSVLNYSKCLFSTFIITAIMAASGGRAVAQPRAAHPLVNAQGGPSSVLVTEDIDAPITQDPSNTSARRPGPYGRPFLIVVGAVPVITYVGPRSPLPSQWLSPSDRFVTAQLIGGGYVVNPRFRYGLIGVFSEALTHLPTGADAWQLGGVAPVAIATPGRLIVGGGPIIAYRSGGTFQSDIGAVLLVGASVPVRKGIALNIVMPITGMFARRVTTSAAVAIGVAKIF